MNKSRYLVKNLGALGKSGDSLFSTLGVPLANDLIESGWVPCGMFTNYRNEVIQAFYLPMDFDFEDGDDSVGGHEVVT